MEITQNPQSPRNGGVQGESELLLHVLFIVPDRVPDRVLRAVRRRERLERLSRFTHLAVRREKTIDDGIVTHTAMHLPVVAVKSGRGRVWRSESELPLRAGKGKTRAAKKTRKKLTNKAPKRALPRRKRGVCTRVALRVFAQSRKKCLGMLTTTIRKTVKNTWVSS